MKVFVIIVTYNGIKWIEQCLNSVLNSTIPSTIVVVDNNSTDGSQEQIKELFPEVELIQSNENLGFGRANNLGIKKAYEDGADYVFLLNQDAWVEPDTIEKLVIAQQRESEYGVISPIHLNGKGDALDYNFSLYINPSKCSNLYSDIYLEKIRKNIYEVAFVNAAAWLISRKCIETVGGFNPSFFHYGEDDNYIQRLKYHKLKVGILAKTTICHDRESHNDNMYSNDELVLYKRKIILKISNPLYNYSFKREYKKVYKAAIKSILFLRIEEFQKIFFKIKTLNGLNRTVILKNSEGSKIIKPSFLN
jgi:GT2 family glycosyltransferase